MNLVHLNSLFESKYEAANENTFQAINEWIKDSDNLNRKHQYKMADSEALSSVLADKLPENLDRRRLMKHAESEYVNRYIYETASQIDDIDVRKSVIQSLNESRVKKNLVFIYLDSLTAAQKSRVRILCKAVWYNLYLEKGE